MGMENYNPPQEPWLVILYQDDHIMVVNKPSGLLSVPGRLEEHKDSVMTRIQRDYPQAESVHRLDMATSGVIVVALTKAAERELKRQFREREPKKQYVARVWGHPSPAEGLVDLPLICDWPNRPKQKVCYETGKPAQTEEKNRTSDIPETLAPLIAVTPSTELYRITGWGALKENILKRIAAAGMPEYAYPDFGYEPQHFDDPAAMFAQRLRDK